MIWAHQCCNGCIWGTSIPLSIHFVMTGSHIWGGQLVTLKYSRKDLHQRCMKISKLFLLRIQHTQRGWGAMLIFQQNEYEWKSRQRKCLVFSTLYNRICRPFCLRLCDQGTFSSCRNSLVCWCLHYHTSLATKTYSARKTISIPLTGLKKFSEFPQNSLETLI